MKQKKTRDFFFLYRLDIIRHSFSIIMNSIDEQEEDDDDDDEMTVIPGEETKFALV